MGFQKGACHGLMVFHDEWQWKILDEGLVMGHRWGWKMPHLAGDFSNLQLF